MPELHGDLFSRHASPLEGYVFVAVDEIGEDVMSDEIFRRNNWKQERSRRDGRSVQRLDWLMNKIKDTTLLLFFSHHLIATMKFVVIRQAPITLELKTISAGNLIKTEDNTRKNLNKSYTSDKNKKSGIVWDIYHTLNESQQTVVFPLCRRMWTAGLRMSYLPIQYDGRSLHCYLITI